MLGLEKLNLSNNFQKKELEDFLIGCGLKLDCLDCAFALYCEDGTLAACGGKEKNVLKCFAVKDSCKGEGLLNTLLSAVITEAYNEGFSYFFVFTKISSYTFFLEAGFKVLEKAEDSVLLFKGEKTPETILHGLYEKHCPAGFKDFPCGAVVLNANPFTLGHRHLVETALKKCGRLYIFVVETDKSFFSFEDRYYLVKKNTEDLKNVCVLPSSQFLISGATFPSYFLKDSGVVFKNQTELDAKIFLKYFVPAFNITERFLGEEISDKVTEQYNNSLLKILPPQCSVEIIERKKDADGIISASKVRRAMQTENLETVRSMLSSVTFDFLKNKTQT